MTLSDSKTTTLSNYIIKGNSYQATRSGKNLFDPKKREIGKVFQRSGRNSTVWYADDSKYASYLYMPMEADTKYTFSVNSDTYWIDRISEMDSSDLCTVNFAFYAWNDNHATYTWTTKPTTTYMAIRFTRVDGADITENDIKNIKFQLEKGSTATEYEPYGMMPSPDFPSEIQSVGNKVTVDGETKYEIPIKVTGYEPHTEEVTSIYLDEPLRCVGDVCDEINFETGEVTRKVKSVILTGNERLSYAGGYFSANNLIASEIENRIYAKSTHFNYEVNVGDGFWIDSTGLALRIKFSSMESIDDLSEWIADNHPEFIYPLSKEDWKTKPIELPEININKGVSNIFVETNIKPSEFILDYYK